MAPVNTVKNKFFNVFSKTNENTLVKVCPKLNFFRNPNFVVAFRLTKSPGLQSQKTKDIDFRFFASPASVQHFGSKFHPDQ